MDLFEGHILAMHKQQWGPDPAAATTAAAAGADGSSDAGAAGASPMLAVTETSSYVNELQNAIVVFK